ncbi:hypothetical protein BGX27_003511, partial [Mortierella sp. AM989]
MAENEIRDTTITITPTSYNQPFANLRTLILRRLKYMTRIEFLYSIQFAALLHSCPNLSHLELHCSTFLKDPQQAQHLQNSLKNHLPRLTCLRFLKAYKTYPKIEVLVPLLLTCFSHSRLRELRFKLPNDIFDKPHLSAEKEDEYEGEYESEDEDGEENYVEEQEGEGEEMEGEEGKENEKEDEEEEEEGEEEDEEQIQDRHLDWLLQRLEDAYKSGSISKSNITTLQLPSFLEDHSPTFVVRLLRDYLPYIEYLDIPHFRHNSLNVLQGEIRGLCPRLQHITCSLGSLANQYSFHCHTIKSFILESSLGVGLKTFRCSRFTDENHLGNPRNVLSTL